MHEFLSNLWSHAVILVSDRNVEAKFAVNALFLPLMIGLRGGPTPFATLLRDPNFWTDATYVAVLPAYILLVAIPFSSNITLFLTAHAPFLNIHLMAGQPAWLIAIVWLVLQDLLLYWQHRAMHVFPWLWAIHKLHHSQQVFSSLTAWRTHWLELLYASMGGILLGQILGPFSGYHVVGIMLLGWIQIASHSGLNWSYGPIGKIIVSPRYHGRHHSSRNEDRDVNFSALLTFWDKLFGTVRDLPLVAPQFGLSTPDDDIPASFTGQFFYPVFTLTRTIARGVTGRRTA